MLAVSILLAISAYLVFYLYDLGNAGILKIPGNRFLFPLAAVLTVLSTAGALIPGISERNGFHFSLLFLIPAAIQVPFLLESLWFCLPKDTYSSPSEKRTVYDRKMYALCRHPGVLFYTLFYIFLAAAVPVKPVFLVSGILTAGNLIYMVLQDRVTFVRIFFDYRDYRNRVPMFFPTPGSIRRCIHDYHRR